MGRTAQWVTIGAAFIAGGAMGAGWGKWQLSEAEARHQKAIAAMDDLTQRFEAMAALAESQSALIDQYSARDPLRTGKAADGPDPGWTVREEVSEVDGRTTTTAYLSSTDSPGHALAARCTGRKLSAFLLVPDFVAGVQRVVARFDKDDAFKTRANASSNGRALFFSNPRKLLQSMTDNKVLRVRYRPYREGERELTLPVAGAADALSAVFKACPAPKPKHCDRPWPLTCD